MSSTPSFHPSYGSYTETEVQYPYEELPVAHTPGKRNWFSFSLPSGMVVYIPLSVLLATANSLTWKRTLNSFRSDTDGISLEFFANQMTNIVYLCMAALVLAYRWRTADKGWHNTQSAFPKKKFILMGLLDMVSGMLAAIGGATTSGQVQTLINQVNIPVTLLFSRLFLGANHTWMQYGGATLITFGALLAALPTLLQDTLTDMKELESEIEGGDNDNTSIGTLLFTLSILPNALSNVYKEANFKSEGLDVYYLTTWVTVYQTLWGFAFLPVLSLKSFGGVPMDQIPSQLSDGWKCLLGYSVPHYSCDHYPRPSELFVMYAVTNFIYNVLLLLITKHGSAMLLVVASALSLPVTNTAFCIKIFMGPDVEPFNASNMIGLGLVFAGFLCYSMVRDPETGEIKPVQGVAGQMTYIPPEPIQRERSITLPIRINSPVISHSRKKQVNKDLSRSLP